MSTVQKRTTSRRGQRINFRASDAEEHLIRRGAAKRGEKVSRFIVESACTAAELALADERQFSLSPAQFARFAEALDRPAQVIPELQKLLREPSVIERSQAPRRNEG